MSITTLRHWSLILSRTADLAPPVDGTSLHLGAMEKDFRAALDLPARDVPVSPPPAEARVGAELALWRCLAHGTPLPEDALSEDRPTLLPSGAFDAIEVFTDAELSAMHALWWMARRDPGGAMARRLEKVRDWHLENTQPDNATNRPWAIHVFIAAQTPESWLYAQTLLHNAIALEGVPTPLAGAILRDAARAVDLIPADSAPEACA